MSFNTGPFIRSFMNDHHLLRCYHPLLSSASLIRPLANPFPYLRTFQSSHNFLAYCKFRHFAALPLPAQMTYTIPLAEARVRPHQKTGLHLFIALALCGIAAIAYIGYRNPHARQLLPASSAVSFSYIYLSIGLFILLVTVLCNKWLLDRKVNITFRVCETLLLLVPLIYCLSSSYWQLSVFLGLLFLTALYAVYSEARSASLIVIISDNGIRLPGAFTARSVLPWSRINQLIVRYGTLTINTLDNKLIQFALPAPLPNENEITTYASQKIVDALPLRVSEW